MLLPKAKAMIFVFLCLFISCNEKTEETTFANPILAGFYPDPSICSVEGDYYLITSSFAYYPGLPVFHSNDLVNWEQIGHVIHRPEQMDFNGHRVSRGLFAPSIRYHNGLFYVVCTLVDTGGNFIVTAENPAGPWSDPVWLPEIDGIDPSPFFDQDGKAYVLYNSVAPNNEPLYSGHRTIRMRSLDLDSLTLGKEEIMLVNGGTDLSKEPVWIEAPHIFFKDGFYYLIAAEGGTGDNHSEVVFRSEEVTGPYVPYENNPILTQRHLDPDRDNPVTSAGHADFVQTHEGDWWAVFLACRPYKDNHYNTGRETFLAPVKWQEDGWCVINPDFEEVQYSISIPKIKKKTTTFPLNGNFTLRDDFEAPELKYNWVFLRNPVGSWYALENGKLSMRLRPQTCAGTENLSFLGHRQQHLQGNASTMMYFTPENAQEKAGMLIFQNEKHHYFLCKSLEQQNPVVQLFQSSEGEMKLLATKKLKDNSSGIRLKIEAQRDQYYFYYAENEGNWELFKAGVDATFLSTKTAGGFVGAMYALYATSNGTETTNEVEFDWFEYQGDDEVFR